MTGRTASIDQSDAGAGGYDGSLLRPGETCWQIAHADRYAVLLENSRYFAALASALDKAEKSIVVLGWQFDPRTRLLPQSPSKDLRTEIGAKLRMLVKQKPDLDVRLLIWRSPLLIAASQGFYPMKAQAWFRKRLVEFRLDSPGPPGACHHQKAVIIDDKVAFCGGGDISTDRWDSEEHLDDDPHRFLPGGMAYPARHETMCVFDGAAARALGDLARERWLRAVWERIEPEVTDSDPWPDGVAVDVKGAMVGLSRTEPGWAGRKEVRENEALHLEGIRRARRLIYMENQYFTSPLIAHALARRLEEPTGPQVVLVTTAQSPSWFDRMTMDTARAEILYRLEAADRHGRFFAFSPHTARGERIVVHAKATIIDDRLLRIGSSNLNNRSMGLDTECDASLEPGTPEGWEAIRSFRHHSIAHFLGVTRNEYAAAEALLGGPGDAIAAFDTGRLETLGFAKPTRTQRAIAEWQLGDPTGTGDLMQPWKRRTKAQQPAVGDSRR